MAHSVGAAGAAAPPPPLPPRPLPPRLALLSSPLLLGRGSLSLPALVVLALAVSRLQAQLPEQPGDAPVCATLGSALASNATAHASAGVGGPAGWYQGETRLSSLTAASATGCEAQTPMAGA